MGLRINPPPKLNRAMTATGYYTGNGNDNRNIDIGVDLISKNNVFVFVKKISTGDYAIFRTDWGQGDGSVIYTTDSGVQTDMIQAFTSTGFQVGAGVRVNTGGQTYAYQVIWTEP